MNLETCRNLIPAVEVEEKVTEEEVQENALVNGADDVRMANVVFVLHRLHHQLIRNNSSVIGGLTTPGDATDAGRRPVRSLSYQKEANKLSNGSNQLIRPSLPTQIRRRRRHRRRRLADHQRDVFIISYLLSASVSTC